MKRFFFAVAGAVFGVALSAQALTFSVVSTNVANFQRSLYAVAVGDTNFVAVGNNSAVLLGQITTNGAIDLFNSGAWFSNSVPSVNKGLRAAAYGSNIFVASGSNNLVFSMTNGGSWKSNGPAYSGNTFEAEGLAFSSGGGGTFAVGLAHNVFARSGVALTSPWSAVTPATNSFLESYRGITPFGTNGFAACGISGVVQVSTDGGLNWNARRLFNYNADPDLLGIATDGTNIVCVGDAAPHTNTFNIVVSTNGGINWFSNAFVMNALVSSSPLATTNPVAKTNVLNALNAVTYAGTNGFIAVGPNGLVIVSTDNGQTWNKQTNNFLTNQNDNASSPWTSLNQFAANSSAIASFTLRGAAYGLKGSQLEGVGVVVGDNGTTNLGTMIIFGNPPEQPTNHGNLTTYADYDKFMPGIPAPTLTVDVPKYATADWYDINSGALVISNSAAFTPQPTANWFNNTPVTSNYWVYARDTRTGLINTNPIVVTLTVRPRPTASVPGTNTFLLGTNTLCNYGDQPYSVNYNLTGIWGTNFTIVWRIGTNSIVKTATSNFLAATSSGALVLTHPNILYPTNALLNAAITNFYWVSNLWDTYSNTVVNISTNLGTVTTNRYTYGNLALAGNQDLIGTNQAIVNPRPTVSLLSTNLPNYKFKATNCNYGSLYTLTNVLTGIGPWTVWWNDGTVQTTNTSSGFGPATLVYTVAPTNSFGANTASNNIYYVNSVSNADTCLGNFPTDILGTNTVTVNPRPTATLLSTNLGNYQFAATNCNYSTNYTITNILTGIGVWTVTWNDGIVQYTNIAAGSSATLVRTVFPTNLFGANAVSNNIYYITSVTDTNACIGSQPGDIRGTNAFVVNPRPTATLVSTNLANYQFTATNCNYSTNYTITNILTGVGPWTVTWLSNGVPVTVPNIGSGAGPYPYVLTVYPTNAFGANVARTNVYYITNVVDINACIGSQPGDILGTNTVTVNPRPTATLLSTNLGNYQFAATNCNYSTNYTITNILTGIGVWTVTWNDGIVQYTNIAAGSSATLVRTVFPTNLFGANAVSNNIYYITSVTDTNACIGSQPGDIRGTNAFVVNPRPTATLVSTNLANYKFAATSCNDGTSFRITNILTGIGVWTVTWNDGIVQYTNIAAGSSATLVRTIFPTNLFGVNVASNNVYYITSVTDTNACVASQPGDIRGTNTFTVNPRPTGTVGGNTNICNGDFALLKVDLTGFGPWIITWSDGVMQTNSTTPVLYSASPSNTNLYASSNFTYRITNLSDSNGCIANAGDLISNAVIKVYPTLSATVTSPDISMPTNSFYNVTANLTGIAPWNVYWSDGTVSSNVFTRTITNKVYGTNMVLILGTNDYVFSITNLTDASSNSCTAALSGSTEIFLVDPKLIAIVSGDTNVCSTITNVQLHVALTNWVVHYQGTDYIFASPWYLSWSDGFIQQVGTTNLDDGGISSTNVSRTVAVSGTTNYTILNVRATRQDGSTGGGGPGAAANRNRGTNFISGSATVTVYPKPGLPAVSAPVITCYDVAVPLFASVPSTNFTVDWFADSAGNNLLLGASTNFVQAVTNSLAEGTSVTNVYWLKVRYADTSLINLCESDLTNVMVIVYGCPTNHLLSFATSGANLQLRWAGNYLLQSTTNLAPAYWTNLVQGVITNLPAGSTNTFIQFVLPPMPPMDFFRLWAPTNWPYTNYP